MYQCGQSNDSFENACIMGKIVLKWIRFMRPYDAEKRGQRFQKRRLSYVRTFQVE